MALSYSFLPRNAIASAAATYGFAMSTRPNLTTIGISRPISEDTLPMTSASGPAAAARPAVFSVASFSSRVMLARDSASPVRASVACLTIGMRVLPNSIPAASVALRSRSKPPFAVSSSTTRAARAAPEESINFSRSCPNCSPFLPRMGARIAARLPRALIASAYEMLP